MRPPKRRRTFRTARFESVEQRLVMSSNPASQFASDQIVQQRIGDEVYPTLVDLPGPAQLSEARNEFGFTGQGQTVVVIDSGIAYSHTALGGGFGAGYRVVGGFDFTGPTDADPYDSGPYGSHGTHVAGIIASDDALHPGVAPGVDLVALRVGFGHQMRKSLGHPAEEEAGGSDPVFGEDLQQPPEVSLHPGRHVVPLGCVG